MDSLNKLKSELPVQVPITVNGTRVSYPQDLFIAPRQPGLTFE